MTKKILSTILTLCMCISLLGGVSVCAETEGIFGYYVEDGQAHLLYIDSEQEDIVVPETLGGYPVVSFQRLLRGDTITSLTLPNSLTAIYSSEGGIGALSVKLTNINVLPDNEYFTSVDGVVFSKDKTKLIYFPGGRGGAYTIPYGVTEICYDAFSTCTSLTSIVIPDSVTKIGVDAFSRCAGLTSVTIPDSVTSIGGGVFSYCTGLTSITIPDSVTSIEWDVFSGCTNLTSMTIPDSVTSIEEYALSGCTGLTSVTIPESVTSIGSCAFSGCTNLTSVIIPDSVTSIGNRAFEDCSNLTIYGSAGSYAESYAKENNIPFVPLISVTVNGNNVSFDQPPVIVDDRTLVPVRAIFEALGAEVIWDAETRTVSAVKGSTSISMVIDTNIINKTINGVTSSAEIDVAAQIIGDRTMVPARAIAEAFDCNVDWNADCRTVIISE